MSTVILTSDRVDITKVGSTPGPSGNNFKVYYCYKRSSSPLVAGDLPLGNYTANFTNLSISPNPATNGWSAEIPDGRDPCYMSTAIFSGNTNEVVSTFSNPIKLVENGRDANNYTIHTTSEEIIKFKRSDSSAERLLWELSPSILLISAFDLNNLSTVSNSNYTPVNNITPEQFNASKRSYYYKNNNNEYIQCLTTSVFDRSETYYIKVSFFEISLLVGSYNLEDILVNLENYLYIIKDSHGEIIDLYNYIFDITKFYNDIINDTIAIDSRVDRLTVINALLNFFDNVSSQDIKISAVLHEDEEVIYNIEKFISVKNGLSEDMLKFDLNASNLNLAILNTGLAFGAEGLTVTNGGFKIYTDNGIDGPKQVFGIDELNKLLMMDGNGIFTGTIYAENGSFTGNINARTGLIGGFDIGAYTLSTNGLTLSADYNDNSFIATLDTSRVPDKPYYTEVDGRYYSYDNDVFDKVGDASGLVYYLEVVNLTELNFNALKTIFYTFSQGTYTLCTEESVFDENTIYYTVGSYTILGYLLVELTDKQFLANPTKYYIYDINNHVYVRCNRESTWMPANDYFVYTIILENIGRHYDSYISVLNINIGTGAVIDDYLKIGNLKLLNPQKHDNKVMDLSSDGTSYFILTNEGYVEGNGWSIKKEPGHSYAVARFGKLIVTDGEFSGIIHATDGVFSGEVTASVINATTLNTVNFVTEKVRAMGGSFIFKPSTNVEEVDEVRCNNLLVDSGFTNGEKVLFKTGAKWTTSGLWDSSSSTYRIEEKPISNKDGNYINFIYKCKNDSEKGWNAIAGAIYLNIYETVKNDDFLTLEYTFSGDFCFDNVSADESPTGWTVKGIRLRIYTNGSNNNSLILNEYYSIEQLEDWNEWQTLIFTNLKVPDGITPNKFALYIYSVGADVEVKVRNLKIERGNNTTPKWTPSLEEVGVNSNGTEIINYLDSEGNIVPMTQGGSGTVTYDNNNHTFTVSGSTGYPCAMKTLALKRKTQYTFKILVVSFTSGGSLPCIGIDKYPITGSAKLMKYSSTIKDNIITLIYTPDEDGNHRLRIFSNCRNYASGATIPNTSVTYSNLTCAVSYKTFLRLKYNNENDFNSYLLSYGDNPVVALSNESITYGLLLSTYNDTNHYAYVDVPNNESYNNILSGGCYSITIFGTPEQDEIIAINSDNTKAGNIIPERALVMEKFGLLLSNGSLSEIDVNLLLGDLSTLAVIDDKLKYISGYGLYADNVFLHGSLMTASGDLSSYAGINTLKLIEFNPAKWGVTGNDYNGEKIIFWGGANSLAEDDIQGSNFIVTDKGSIFASKGIFKGAVISDSLMTNTIILTPIIYGSGKGPSLKIYDTNSASGIGGIEFYKKVGEIDNLNSSLPDIKTLSLSNSGFIHYQNNSDKNGFKFIGFGETNKNVDMYATTFNADKTQFRSKNIEDSLTGGLIQFNNRAVRIKQNSSYIDVDEENIINNTSGKVINKPAMEITDGTRTLSYRIKTVNNQSYYCLYVTDLS